MAKKSSRSTVAATPPEPDDGAERRAIAVSILSEALIEIRLRERRAAREAEEAAAVAARRDAEAEAEAVQQRASRRRRAW